MHPTATDLTRLDTALADTTLAHTAAAQPPHADLQPRDEAGRCGFQLGWDHARHGLVPAAELLAEGTPVGQGWRAGKAVFGRRSLPTTPALRGWLQLRTVAWRAGLPFDGLSVTPKWLARLAVSHCPVTRMPLGGASGADSAPVTVCLDASAGFRAGNLAVLSQRAAVAMAGLDMRGALRQLARTAKAADAGKATACGLSPEEQARLLALVSQRTPLTFCDAARMPLHVLPPPQVEPINPVQALQVSLTRQFATPGWSLRLRALAERLPVDAQGHADAALRHDFNLFIGALAPRLLGAGVGRDGSTLATALEDAWVDPRVQRRWQRFVAALGEGRTALLLETAAAKPGLRVVAAPRSGDRHGAGRTPLRGRPLSDVPSAHMSVPRSVPERGPIQVAGS